MRKNIKRLFCALFTAAFAVSLVVGNISTMAGCSKSNLNEWVASFKEVTGLVDLSGVARANFNSKVLKADTAASSVKTVIVSLDGVTLADGITEIGDGIEYVNSAAGKAAARAAENTQNTFLKRLTALGVDYTLVRSYNVVDNAVAIKVDTSAISEIKSIKGVKSAVISATYSAPQSIVTEDMMVGVSNDANVYKTGIYNSGKVREEYGYEGEGVAVAVIDTGIDYTHQAFSEMPKRDTLKLKREDIVKVAESLNAYQRGTFDKNDFYLNEKVPYAFDYADSDADVYPSYSNHGTHVAGIIAGHADSYDDKDGNTVYQTDGEGNVILDSQGQPVPEEFWGVAPSAQLVICKVFTDDLSSPDLGGALATDILAAVEDCIILGVDVINMSLGTTAGFSWADDDEQYDDEGWYMDRVYDRVRDMGVSLVTAASNDYSSGYGGTFGTNLAINPDSGTVGSPSTFSGALSVASVSGQRSKYMLGNAEDENKRTAVFFQESSDENNVPFDFLEQMLGDKEEETFEYVVVPGVGLAADFVSVRSALEGKIALIKRGNNTFQEKIELAKNYGAKAAIVYNNVAGMIRMSLGDMDDPIPAVSVSLDAGTALVNGATRSGGYSSGTITLSQKLLAGPFLSEFSSWGPTPDLKLKPEITAHGGEITSSVPGGWGEQSGTSMASPNMAGFIALLRGYVANEEKFARLIQEEENIPTARKVTQIVNQLVMSTATVAHDESDLPYSPRKQGAGLANMLNTVTTNALIFDGETSFSSAEDSDRRPKLEFGDDADKQGVYEGTFKVGNFGNESLKFTPDSTLMTETLAIDGLGVAEKAHLLTDIPAEWKVDGTPIGEGDEIEVPAGETVTISVTLKLSDAEKKYIGDNFENGMYVEGFITLKSSNDGQPDLTMPFLGFYGNWADAPMLDLNVFEVAAIEQDSAYTDENRPSENIWATQAFAAYYNDNYVLPIGSYLYDLPDNADPMYSDEEYCSVSRYNDYSFDERGYLNGAGYYTSTRIRALYAGLLRSARRVDYTLTDAYTGETIESRPYYRIGKAYAGGGSARPAYIQLDVDPSVYGLVNNNKYTMSFDFNLDWKDGSVKNGNTNFTFSFYVDYDAPIVSDVRVRYYNYKDNNKDRQRIYLDVDVFDNHYAQDILLCYPSDDGELILATDYVTPVRNANKNGTTTVSIEVTDIFDEYGSNLYLQVEDYALNHSTYKLDLTQASRNSLPDTFEIADSDKEMTLEVYETKKVSLIYDGDADPSNFVWRSGNPGSVQVKNGEIAALRVPSGGRPVTVFVSGKDGKEKEIKVNVVEGNRTLGTPSLSFSTIKNSNDAISAGSGLVDVNPGEVFELSVLTDPWYYPIDDPNIGLDLEWSSSDESVVSVDNTSGSSNTVRTLKEGTAILRATIKGTRYEAQVILNVVGEFTVDNFTLNEYHGVGTSLDDDGNVMYEEGTVFIPTDMNIMYIGEEAFEGNDKIKKIIIPRTVTQIQQLAFANMPNLEEVYFIDDKPTENGVADAELNIISYGAFINCPKLKKVDLTNVRVITLDTFVFANCTSLSEIVHMEKIGTANANAFERCTSLTDVDLSGLHSTGVTRFLGDRGGIFNGCTNLGTVTTGRYTALGGYMFSGSNIKEIVIRTPFIGENAFNGLTSLTKVTFENPEGYDGNEPLFEIGRGAFSGCTNLATIEFKDGVKVRSIGDNAFRNTKIGQFTIPDGLESMGTGAFSETKVTSITLNDNVDISLIAASTSPFRGIQEFVVPENSATYSEVDGVLYNKDQTVLILVPGGKTGHFGIPDTVTEIAANAFNGSSIVKSIDKGTLTFTDGGTASVAGVTAIGDYAFANTRNLESVTLGNIEELGVGAFSSSSLSSFGFGDSTLTEIKAETFRGTDITSVDIPDSVMSVAAYAFADTGKLTAASLGKIETLGEYAFSSSGIQTIDFKDSTLKEIPSGAFSGTQLKEVDIPNSVERIGNSAFSNSGLSSFGGFEYGLEIGSSAFENCDSLTSIVLSDTVSILGSSVFRGCDDLTSVTLGNVESMGSYNFSGASRLASLTYGDEAKVSGSYNFMTRSYNSASLPRNTALTELNLGGVTDIEMYAFAGANNLESVDLGGVVTMGEAAFYSAGLTSVNIPASLTGLGYGAFAGNSMLEKFTVDENSRNFFEDDGVLYRKFVVGGKITDDYELVLYPAKRAAAANDGVKSYAAVEGTLSIAGLAFYDIDGALDEVVLPYSVTLIGDRAFYGSGIKVFRMYSIEAPVLLSGYVSDQNSEYGFNVDPSFPGGEYALGDLDSNTLIPQFYSMYYANFEDHFAKYTYGDTENDLVLYTPANGVGYDNFVYKNYFPSENRVSLGVMMDNVTRAAIKAISALDAQKAKAWLSSAVDEGERKQIEEYIELVATAISYRERVTDETQIAFLDEGGEGGNLAKLSEIESVLLQVIRKYSLPLSISRVTYLDTYKKNYKVGEKFDMTGLEIVLHYSNGLSEICDPSAVTLLTDRALTVYDRAIYVQVDGYNNRIPLEVKVTEDVGTDSSASENETGCGAAPIIAASSAGGAVVVAAIIVTAVVIIKKKRSR